MKYKQQDGKIASYGPTEDALPGELLIRFVDNTSHEVIEDTMELGLANVENSSWDFLTKNLFMSVLLQIDLGDDSYDTVEEARIFVQDQIQLVLASPYVNYIEEVSVTQNIYFSKNREALCKIVLSPK